MKLGLVFDCLGDASFGWLGKEYQEVSATAFKGPQLSVDLPQALTQIETSDYSPHAN